MDIWKAQYLPLPREFALLNSNGTSDSLSEPCRSSADVPAREAVACHRESVRFLPSNTDPEDRMDMLHRSLSFLSQLLLRFQETAAAKSSVRHEDGGPDSLPAESACTPSAAAECVPAEQLVTVDKPNRFEEVLQHMDTGVAIFDKHGVLRFLNVQMSRMLKTPRHALIDLSLRKLFFHRQLSRSIRFMLVRMLKEMTRNHRFHLEFQTEGRYFLVSVTEIEELDGDYLVSVKDVSDFKQIEQSAMQNDKLAMLGKIAAAIAHEIRNPLTAIRGFIQLLTPYLAEIGKEDYARIILSEIDRANHIIYEFLNSSKPSAPTKQRISVAMLLREMILLTESEANMKGCELVCEIADADMAVAIDVKQIKQVLLNIVKNAMDAIQETGDGRKGWIGVSARRDKRYALISIRDNGKGMERSTINRLFDPFFSTKKEGTGLGLSVSYRIIRNHGGMIRVESTPGEGTEFSIYLPLDPQDDADAETRDAM